MRPSKDEYWLNIVQAIASRATCPRRKVGCIITDDDGHLISSGYNGTPVRMPHCIDVPCDGANDVSGDSSRCAAIHGEVNAFIQAGDRLRWARNLYCTTLPCYVCAKMIASSQIVRVIYIEDYADDRAVALFKQNDIDLIQVKC